ncbi:MAG TPA: type II secretion system F family protein [Dehalococcoidia bacterium]|jgi:tight adherence protein B|nr:type II secretion system F family protein [Dehalococcoidia bacterium]
MDPIALLAALCILGFIVCILMAIYQASASPRGNLERRLGSLMGDASSYEVTAASFEGLRSKRVGTIPIISSLLQSRNTGEELAIQLERADMKLTASEFVAVRIFLGLFGLGLPVLMLGTSPVGILCAFGGAIVGYSLPKFYMAHGRSKRVNKLNAQLPDTLTMLANALKSGFGLMQSMDLVARELEHPIATDIRRMLQDINVGAATDEALANFARRSGSSDLDIVVTAMLIQQSTGGNLAEILETVGHTMRERIRIRGEIKTLTTQQVMTGAIIGALPIFIALAISVINPDYIGLLFTRTVGQVMIAGAIMMELFGMFVIKRILAIEV